MDEVMDVYDEFIASLDHALKQVELCLMLRDRLPEAMPFLEDRLLQMQAALEVLKVLGGVDQKHFYETA